MKDYSNYNTFNSFDRKLHDGKKIFELAKRGLTSYDAIIDEETFAQVIVEQAYNPYSEKKEERMLKCDMGIEIGIRSTVRLLDTNDIYIVITEIDDNRIFKYFKGIRTNNTLKWQDKYFKVHEIPINLSYATSLSSDGLLKRSDMLVLNDQAKIIAPRYEPILDIPLGQRLIFNHSKHSVFKYTRAEELSNKGVISMALKIALYNDKVDNLETNLSNEVIVDDSTDSTPNHFIRITSTDNIVKKNGYGLIEYDITKDDIMASEDINVIISNPSVAEFIEITDDLEVVIRGLEFGEFTLRIELVSNPLIFAERIIKVSGL